MSGLAHDNHLLFLDTGSSDTWVAERGLQCLNGTDNTISPQDYCTYNKTYNISSTFKQISNQTFGVKYGAGIASGVVGYEKVTFGGLTLDSQEIGVADKITDPGDGNDSGVLGLGYPALTSAHPGTNYSNASLSFFENRTLYSPLFTSLYKSGLVDPYFSLALNRPAVNISNGSGGTLSLGTLPNIAHNPTFAVAPVEIMAVIPPLFTNNIPQKSYWALTIKGTTYASSTNHTPFQAIVDCGNFLNYLPAALALAANNAFSPPATRNADFEANGQYDVACNATAPRFGLEFSNNVTVFMDPLDMIVQNADGSCGSTVADADQIGASAGILLPILGTPFLRSVLAVFDFGEDEMRFAGRADANASTVTGGNSTIGGSGCSTVASPRPTASTLVVSDAGSKPVVSFVALVTVVFLTVELVL
jgi:Eukaryotic aspartyl protease